jgi:hypothetical protein
MKRLYIFIITIFLYLGAFAQGNLQFNQVKLVSTIETVPAGKVWKVENYLPSSQLAIDLNRPPNQSTAGGTKNFIMLVNSNQVFLQTTITREVGRDDAYWNQSGYTTASDYKIFDAPIWLPASTTLAASTNVLSLSVIEFNIIP